MPFSTHSGSHISMPPPKMVVNESGFHTMLLSDARMSDAGAIRCVAKNRSGVAEFQVKKKMGGTVLLSLWSEMRANG